MPEEPDKKPDMSKYVEARDAKSINRTFRFTHTDNALLEWASEFLGCSRSDVVRGAVRAYVVGLQAVEKSMR